MGSTNLPVYPRTVKYNDQTESRLLSISREDNLGKILFKNSGNGFLLLIILLVILWRVFLNMNCRRHSDIFCKTKKQFLQLMTNASTSSGPKVWESNSKSFGKFKKITQKLLWNRRQISLQISSEL